MRLHPSPLFYRDFSRLSVAATTMAVPQQRHLQQGTPVNIVLKDDQRTGKLSSGRIADILTKFDHPRGIKVRLHDGRVGRVQSLGEGTSTMPTMMMQTGSGQGVSGGGGGGVGNPYGRGGDDELAFARGHDVGEQRGGEGVRRMGMRGGRIQDDVRNDPVPVEERSLDQYIKAPSRNKGKKGRKGGSGGGGGGEGSLAMGTATATANMDGHMVGVGVGVCGKGEEALGLGHQGAEGNEKTTQEQLEGEFPGLDSALIAAIMADHEDMVDVRDTLKGLDITTLRKPED